MTSLADKTMMHVHTLLMEMQLWDRRRIRGTATRASRLNVVPLLQNFSMLGEGSGS